MVGRKYLVPDAVTLLPPSGALVSSEQYRRTQTVVGFGIVSMWIHHGKGMRTFRSSPIMISLSHGIEGLLGASSACGEAIKTLFDVKKNLFFAGKNHRSRERYSPLLISRRSRSSSLLKSTDSSTPELRFSDSYHGRLGVLIVISMTYRM